MACKWNLDLRCVLISDLSTLGAGAQTRLHMPKAVAYHAQYHTVSHTSPYAQGWDLSWTVFKQYHTRLHTPKAVAYHEQYHTVSHTSPYAQGWDLSWTVSHSITHVSIRPRLWPIMSSITHYKAWYGPSWTVSQWVQNNGVYATLYFCIFRPLLKDRYAAPLPPRYTAVWTTFCSPFCRITSSIWATFPNILRYLYGKGTW